MKAINLISFQKKKIGYVKLGMEFILKDAIEKIVFILNKIREIYYQIENQSNYQIEGQVKNKIMIRVGNLVRIPVWRQVSILRISSSIFLGPDPVLGWNETRDEIRIQIRNKNE